MTDPDIPESDTKDWTWVLERPCPDCGFDASSIEPADFARLTRENIAFLVARLYAPGAAERPGRGRGSRAPRVVAPGVRVSRARRVPGLRRAPRVDARRHRSAVRELGPG